jgi:hypothetical protein
VTRTTVYVELLGEGVRVWRPAEAEELASGRYRLIATHDYDDSTETWKFVPGTIVRCEQIDIGLGPVPVAVESFPP